MESGDDVGGREVRARLLALVPLLIALALAGCGGGSSESVPRAPVKPSIDVAGLFPDFDPAQKRYVSRCDGATPAPAGVRPGEDFTFTAARDGARETYRVRCLPADFPEWEFESLRPTAPGFFTVAFQASRDERPWVIVFDNEGVPRWWFNPGTRALWAQVLRDGTIAWARSFGDGYGVDPRMAFEIRSPDGRLRRVVNTDDAIIDGHEFHELPDGDFLTDSYVPRRADLRRFGGPRRAAAVSAVIQEVDPRGRLLWHWSSRGRIGLGETGRWWRNVLSNAKPGLGSRPTFDPVHINSVEPRGSAEVVISTRHTDAVYGIDRATGEIRWKLGGTPTAQSLEVVGDPARKLLGGQHDARISRDGTLSVYDNGKDRPRRPRVVFYRLDLEQGRAVYRGQLNDPEIDSSHCCGSARQLDNDGWLVSWGNNPLVTEFDPEGRIAFRLRLPASTFRAVPVPAGAITAAELDRGLEKMERR